MLALFARAEAERVRELFALSAELRLEDRFAFETEPFDEDLFAFTDELLAERLFDPRDEEALRLTVEHFTRLRLLPRAPRERRAFVHRTGCGFGRVQPTS